VSKVYDYSGGREGGLCVIVVGIMSSVYDRCGCGGGRGV
jgi:hypothetical protein